VAVVLTLLAVLVFFLVVVVFWPLLSLLVALAVGGVVVVARVMGVAPWKVRAVSADRTHEWRVRGVLRSRRVKLAVARALERGGEAGLDGETNA
jgi:hypothetical protein